MSNKHPNPFQLLAKRNLQICGVEITVIDTPTNYDTGVMLPDNFCGTVGLSYEFSLLGTSVFQALPKLKTSQCATIKDDKTFRCDIEVIYKNKKKKTTKYKVCFHAVNEDDQDNDPSEDVIDMD